MGSVSCLSAALDDFYFLVIVLYIRKWQSFSEKERKDLHSTATMSTGDAISFRALKADDAAAAAAADHAIFQGQ